MPPSFRNRFRRSPPEGGGSTAATNDNNNSIGAGVGRFLGRSISNSSSQQGYSPRRQHHGRRQNQQQQQHPPLATFDACIEACDALAASSLSSRHSQHHRQQQQHNQNERQSPEGVGSHNSGDDHDVQDDDGSSDDDDNENHDDQSPPASEHQQQCSKEEEEIPDCSVLVSPDGALLFTSHGNIVDNSFGSADNQNLASSSSSSESSTTQNKNKNNNNNQNDKYPWTKISTEDRDGVILEEEYSSAIICGNDLTPNGDADSNGFTARGWNPDAATLALGVGRDVLDVMDGFVTEMASCQKQKSTGMNDAVGRVSDFRTRLVERNQFRRVGPILSRGTNLSVAMEAMEEYYASVAIGDLERWRVACSENRGSALSHHSSTSIEMKEMNNNKKDSDQQQQEGNKPKEGAKYHDPELIHGILPKLRTASLKADARTNQRERAISTIRSKLTESQTILQHQKQWAASQWRRVHNEECNIDRLYAIKKMEQHEFYETQRREHQEGAYLGQIGDRGEMMMEGPLSEEVWEMVQGVASLEDFGHTGYSPRSLRKIMSEDEVNQLPKNTAGRGLDSEVAVGREQQQQHHQHQQQHQHPIPPRIITRADVEKESEIHDLRLVAHAADESVEDAAGKLLNIMSKADTTLRSARLAAESCLLSECNAVHDCLKSLVAMERTSLEEKMRRLVVLEAAVDAIDVRKDIDCYIQADKNTTGGRSRAGEDDDGGIAAALAVLNSHGERMGGMDSPRKYRNIERPSHFEGWGDGGGGGNVSYEEEDDGCMEPELIGDVIRMLFEENTSTNGGNEGHQEAPDSPSRAPD
ncbi:hypothetical protein ACHAXR_004145, partial [Thalassiosira sp. AJA248-18]